MTLKPKRVAPKVWTGASKFCGKNGEEIIIKEVHYQPWLETMKDGRNKDTVGNGEEGAYLHNDRYEFNDEILPVAAGTFVALVDALMGQEA